jgi:YaaC-like Protein
MREYTFHSIQSESIALKMLKGLHPDANSSGLYRSAAKVAASARLTNRFTETATLANFAIQPLLRYYALLHGMKTVLYALDLSYPNSSSVLQHGVSVRRTKREAYAWPKESVHVYKEGVLQSFAAFHEHELPIGSRITVGHLLGYLPGLHHGIAHMYPEYHHVYPVVPASNIGIEHRDICFVPRSIASNRSLTVEEWKASYCACLGISDHNTLLSEKEPDGLLAIPYPSARHPWVTHHKQLTYIYDNHPLPEWLIHFVVLYTLSALCRYNPTEWSDITLWHNDADAYLIREYLITHPTEEVLAGLLGRL